ncbi:Membrane dipeptidase (Peptidase family M19) [Sphingomonas haloaromaticamans]|uniref:Membrane dipeptidase (Peptidase family M19) n=1 Tax=Edaphosphingomonas haloaromaticamans TaxID=653954 RepID=A0A1S1HG55_9SPHN|nr:membrane dipeptidase [Sphingomonas haloaromaticamans]OHT21077.1 Membrane dipeptidase (Peptidase family M19) [Sphingomonas haloaromaticamans]
MSLEQDRRAFLALGAGMLAAPALSAPARALAATPAAADPIANMIVINALGGFDDPNDRSGDAAKGKEGPSPLILKPRVLADARASGQTAVNITIGYVSGKKEPFQQSVADVASWDRLIRENPRDLIKILTAADIRRAKAEGRMGLILGFQNAAMMGDDASRVDIFADLGVRIVQLTYNPANQLGDGSMAPENRGITPFGREVIERLNANRVMVDLSHSGQRTCLEAARASKQPISINHTGCRAVTDVPRNKTDEELRLVADRGGFVGIYFMPFLNPTGHARAEDVVAHIDHAVNVCGEDHVGIGTDGGTTPIDDLKAYEADLAKEIAERRAAGISATGERPDTYPFVVDLRGQDQFRKLAGLLRQKGYSTARIEKILGLNFVRYAEEIWAGETRT